MDQLDRYQIERQITPAEHVAALMYAQDHEEARQYLRRASAEHLTTSQRAAIGAQIQSLPSGMNQFTGAPREGVQICTPSLSTEKTAAMMAVSKRQLQRARQLKREDPDAFAEVRRRGPTRAACGGQRAWRCCARGWACW